MERKENEIKTKSGTLVAAEERVTQEIASFLEFGKSKFESRC